MGSVLGGYLGALRMRGRQALHIIFYPAPGWHRVRLAREAVGPLFLFYVLPLGAISPVASVLGNLFMIRPDMAAVPQLSTEAALRAGVTTALLSWGAPFLVAVVIRLVAPLYELRTGFAAAFRVAAYALTPLWLSAVVLLAPVLVLVTTIVLLHSLYLLTVGLEVVLEVPSKTSAEYTALVVMVSSVLLLPVGWVAAWSGLF